jgi:hypothetical protein
MQKHYSILVIACIALLSALSPVAAAARRTLGGKSLKMTPGQSEAVSISRFVCLEPKRENWRVSTYTITLRDPDVLLRNHKWVVPSCLTVKNPSVSITRGTQRRRGGAADTIVEGYDVHVSCELVAHEKVPAGEYQVFVQFPACADVRKGLGVDIDGINAQGNLLLVENVQMYESKEALDADEIVFWRVLFWIVLVTVAGSGLLFAAGWCWEILASNRRQSPNQ